jgi:Asp-tRNA(Asn)/Glu-tRNA(Gln) amidotransferase A subunit family amidase
MEQLHKLSLREIVAGIRHKRWNASAVMRSHAERIAAREPEVQAWEHLDLERAMRHAERADVATSTVPAAEARALEGVPVAIKDIIDVAGMPTRYGAPIYASAAPAFESAECVEALQRAGAIALGKTVTTEFAYYTPGKTRNPWNAKHTPGGSSMGSAASVACGMAACALGTQTNGSVIRPAAFCGIVGYKPSYGTVSNHGTLDPWPTLDHTGVFGRHVGDAALLASVITRRGTANPGVLLPAHTLKIGLVRSPVWHLAEASQKHMLESNATALRHAGAKIEDLELPPPFEDAHRVHRAIMAYEGARYFRDLQARFHHLMSARFNELLDEGAAISEDAYTEALRAAEVLRQKYAALIARYDAIITPPATGEAPATLEETGNPAFCTLWTLLGVPAVTVPVGFGPAGLPLGLQIVGAYLEDDAVLGAAAWCESHIPFHGLR